MTRILMDIAERECGGKLLCVLEGGYDLEAWQIRWKQW